MYLHSQINIAEGQKFSIDFTAGRGPNGLTAAIDIRAAASVDTPKSAPTRTAPKAVQDTPAPVAEPEPTPEPEVVMEEAPEEEAQPETSEEDEAPAKEKPAAPVKTGKSIFSKAS
jgi:hypothetical protein